MRQAQTLRRKCGCGATCGPCREKRELRRSAIDPRRPERVPGSVGRVLSSSGMPLDASLRRTLEPRFGHDFSSVRVHTGPDAETATRDVHARAWTLGNHIAFGRGQSPRDLGLLAHELTHVVQQSDAPQASSLSVGPANDPAETEADAAASAVLSGRLAPIASRSQPAVRRFIPGPIQEAIRQAMALFPSGRVMTDDEIKTAEKVTGRTAPATGAVGAGTAPLFVLHDTAALVSDTRIAEEKDKKGPQGKGVQVWLPQRRTVSTTDPVTRKKTKTTVTPDPVITRGPFYEQKRPSATAYERGEDIISLTNREIVFRAAWKVTTATEQDTALDTAVAAVTDAAEQTKIRDAARAWLKGSETEVDGAKTAGMWAIEEICGRAKSAGAAAVTVPDKPRARTKNADKLDKECATVAPLFQARAKRIPSIVGVEIVQPADAAPLPNPPYTAKQYDDLAKLYIRAALEARRWPKIITHRELDRPVKSGGHGDPRCFNLNELYRLIAGHMGHNAKTIYGIIPKYGTGTDANVFWTKTACHGAPPK